MDGDDWDHFLKDNLIHVQRYKDRQLFDGCIFVTLGSEGVRVRVWLNWVLTWQKLIHPRYL